ncbi:MAG: transposase family protein, partial [Zoogloeaceae bacterium]|nr:transposase family protein [Zoogloeaceae bacterium]
MKVERKLTLKDVFALVRDPRQTKKVEHDLVDVLVVAAVAVLCGADTFVEVEA